MGMFDYVRGKCKCPNCGRETIVEEQIKWTEYPSLKYYNINQPIDAEDGEYDYGSLLRNHLVDQCTNCNKYIQFSIIVENGILKEIKPLKSLNKDEYCRLKKLNNYRFNIDNKEETKK